MLEALKNRYPGCWTLPAESEIRIEIQSLFNKQKKIAAGGTISTGWKAYAIKIPDMVKEHLESTGKILTVNEANQKFKDRYTAEERAADDFPTEKQIKSKCTREIAKLKKPGV